MPLLLPVLLTILAQSPQPESPLAGHKVEVAAAKPTIVSLDIDGRVRRPEASPEEAAVAQLKLEDAERAKVDEVFIRRARVLDKFIENNLPLLQRLGTAESAPKAEKFAVAWETFQKSKDLRTNGPLDQQVREALPPARAPEFDKLLKEYWDAIANEDRQHPQPNGKPKGRIGAVLEEKFKSLGREIESAYKRSEKSGGLLYHYLFDDIKLNDDQAKEIKKLCAAYAEKGLDNKEKTAQGVFFVSIMQLLDHDQQVKLGKKFNPNPPAKKKRKTNDN